MKPLESPLNCKEIQPVHPKAEKSWVFFGRNDAKAETPVLWPPHVRSWLIGKDSDVGRDLGQEEKGTTEDEVAGWHHRLDGCEFEWTLGVGDGQGGLACCDSRGRRVRHDWATELNWYNFYRCHIYALIYSIFLFLTYFVLQSLGSFTSLRASVHAQLCPTLCNPIYCSPPGPSVLGIFQARILKWVAIFFFRGSFRLRDQNPISWISYTDKWILHQLCPWEAPMSLQMTQFCSFLWLSNITLYICTTSSLFISLLMDI